MKETRLERKKNITRQALLDSALALFAQRGIYSPSIEEITESADLGKGTFYKYFPSRDELIAALVRQGLEQLLDGVNRKMERLAKREKIIENVLEAHQDFFREHPEYLLLFHQARGWLKLPGVSENPICKEFGRYVSRMSEFIPASSGRKVYMPAQRVRMARILAGFISGVLSFQYILTGGFDTAPDLQADMAALASMMGI